MKLSYVPVKLVQTLNSLSLISYRRYMGCWFFQRPTKQEPVIMGALLEGTQKKQQTSQSHHLRQSVDNLLVVVSRTKV